MKYTLLLALLCCILSIPSFAQGPIPNVDGHANAIIGKLTKSLSLKEDQQLKLKGYISDFITQRNTVVAETATNPKAYDAKIKSMHNGFYKKLKTALTAEQYETFLQQKPAENDPTNVLSQLYY
ncbi:MAG: hypothetical protein H6Q26_3185 [Bacteroidetes bacterium]|uniref:hypothetical protein n=1 Tax=unclassified Chitinophaga TaxID=2619133 RepID=UPI0009CDECB4|nr:MULTISPECIES: hypothetical protein [unclassified Chitinophaga]MBP1653028.1 hypothetical protein [Bacteroidota bacterium]OMP77226.1 hypothetical protein BW716_21235 [[Flexibacter] sp. ATCC 35208]WPV67417.1 hypothetical protein QQL36_01585 [Chitinophaga sp. LS1]